MIYTIGHSNHSIDKFQQLLLQHRIEALADVRSTPYSRFNPQFGRDRLRASLAEQAIQYVFLGEELGARSTDPDCYCSDGKVSYHKLAQTDLFRRGLDRLLTGMRAQRIAVMCAEREPLDCHRTILVARELVRAGAQITHILSDGTLEEHDHAMQRLAADLKIPQPDLCGDAGERIERAYDLQAARIAYVRTGTRK